MINTIFQLSVVVGLVILTIMLAKLFLKTRSEAQDLQQQLQSLKAQQSEALHQALKRQSQSIKLVEHENVEQQQLIQHMDGTISQLSQGIKALEQQLQELQQRDPEVRLYQQAKQLIASGTSIDEVVESCGIPRAEAELLFSLAKQSPTSDWRES